MEYKLGLVYPFKFLNAMSSINNDYGWFEYMDGLNKGVVLGAAFRKYYVSGIERLYLQAGIDVKLLRMDNARIITEQGANHYTPTVDIDGNHRIINPKILFGLATDTSFF